MLECWNVEFKERLIFEILYWKFEDYFEIDFFLYLDTENFVR